MKVLLTIDYELFNGVIGGSVDLCIIKPMEELEKILDIYDYKATIFADACFLLTLDNLRKQRNDLQNDWERITSQLRRLSQKGHSIQLHLHPQWLNAENKNGIWYSDLRLYKLSDLKEKDARLLISNGCKIIKDITGVAPIAFRAGDYCVQTYASLMSSMLENGLVVDSSVLRYKRCVNEREWFDYTHIPNNYCYRFSNNVAMENLNGCFWEVSIPTYKHSPLAMCFRKRKIPTDHNRAWGDGRSSTGGELDSGIKKTISRIRSLLHHRMSASIDGLSATYLEDVYRREKVHHSPYMMIMGHPKSFTPYYLDLFSSFISKLDKEDEFVTIENIIYGSAI